MTTVEETDRYLKEIERIVNSKYNVKDSRRDFEDFIKGFTKDENVVDPNELQETVNNFTDRFERLKFLFLEQEAKEQFLRLILEQNTKYIDRDEVLKSVEEGEELKKISRAKEDEINNLTLNIETNAIKVHNDIEKIEVHKENTLKLISSIKQSQTELNDINEILNKLNSNDPTIERLKKLKEKYGSIEINDEDFTSLSAQDIRDKIQEIKSLRSQNVIKLQQLESLKISKIKLAEQTKHLKQKLEDKDKELNESIKRISNEIENKELPDQNKLLILNEEKVIVLQQIWNKISFISSFKQEGSNFFVKFKDFDNFECSLELNTIDDSIKSIQFDKIAQIQLEKIRTEANDTNSPLFHATVRIYDELRRK